MHARAHVRSARGQTYYRIVTARLSQHYRIVKHPDSPTELHSLTGHRLFMRDITQRQQWRLRRPVCLHPSKRRDIPASFDMVRVEPTPFIMKSLFFALLTALILTIICVRTASAEPPTGPVASRIERVLDGMTDHGARVTGDSVYITSRITGDDLFVATASGTSLALTATSHRDAGAHVDVVDMAWLDASSVGVLLVDRTRRAWRLTHSIDTRRATDGELEDIITRFADEVERLSTRSLELTRR